MQPRWKKILYILSFVFLISSVVIYVFSKNNDAVQPVNITKEEVAAEQEPVDDPPEIKGFYYSTNDGSTVSGDVELTVEVADDKGISKVEFYSSSGDYLIGEVTEEPYTINWATNPWVENGEQILKVIVYDSSNQKEEVTETVTVKNAVESVTGYKMVGYYAGWASYSGYEVSDIDGSKLTHINYAFANISDEGKIVIGDPSADIENFKQLIKLKERYPHLKTMISVGGWTWSRNFSDAALTEESRAAFAESVRRFILEYGFDGVDLDWEYPVSGGDAGNINRPEDKENYTLLLKKIREMLDQQSEKDGKEYLLTIAAGASKGHAANMELGKLHAYLDYIQLMTYDIHGEWDALTGLNAPLYENSHSGWSVQEGVETYIARGVPADKLVMGMPFYGRVFHEVSNGNNGLNQPFSGGSSLTFEKINADFVGKNGFSRQWKEESKVPVLYDGFTFISYDDEESIGLKTGYIETMGLGGAMMWELSQDPDEVLLNRIYEDLNRDGAQ